MLHAWAGYQLSTYGLYSLLIVIPVPWLYSLV
jgi:hypothetical protein